MFKLKYKFSKGDFTFSDKYPVNSTDEVGNLFVIRGPNESGKSTLLQMVALGLKANEPPTKESLRNKINRLISKGAKLDFDLDIVDKTGNIKIHSKKETVSKDVSLELNNSKISTSNFKEKFQVIFDVPDDPLIKLKEAIGGVKDIFEKYDDDLGSRIEAIGGVIAEVKAYQKSDLYKKSIKSEIKADEKELTESKKEKVKVEKEFSNLKQTYICNKYERLTSRLALLDEERKKINGRLKKFSSADTERAGSKVNKLVREFNQFLLESQKEMDAIESLNKVLNKSQLKLFDEVYKKIKSIDTPDSLDVEGYNDLHKNIISVMSFLDSHPITKEKLKEEEPYEVYTKLIDILSPFSSKRIPIPGTNLYVKQFLLKLKKQAQSLEAKLSEKRKITSALDNLSSVKDKLRLIKEQVLEISKLNALGASTDKSSLKNRKESFEKEMGDLLVAQARMEKEYLGVDKCIKDDVNRTIKDFEELERDYLAMESNLKSINESIDLIEYSNKERKKQLEKLESQQSPPKHTKKLRKLEQTKTRLLLIQKKINDSRELLRKLSNLKEDVSLEELSNDEKSFCDGLSVYLANILEKVYYLGKWYKLKRVNFIESSFVVESLKYPIKFEDLSTGRSQTTALMTQLKQNPGNKTKIVLFDEIQILDRNSLQIILDELESQAKSGKLLLAILARVDDSIKKPVLEKIW